VSPALDAIQEVNLSYLMLAQRLLRENMADGMFRLGANEQVANIILKLTPAQILKLSAAGSLLCGLRLNEAQLWSALTQEVMGGLLQQAHTTMLLAQRAVDPAEQPGA